MSLGLDTYAYSEVTLRTGEIYGKLFVYLQNQGTPIPTNDIWIAGTACECRGELASDDDHFWNSPEKMDTARLVRLILV